MRLLLAVLVLLPSLGQADCAPSATELFSCTFGHGRKTVSICLNGDSVRYGFGRPGRAPELELDRPVRQVGMTPWNGVGRSMWEEMWIDNRSIRYVVSSSFDRLSEGAVTEGQLQVIEGEQQLALLVCDPDSVRGDLYALLQAKEKAGQFWCPETQSWQDKCDG